MQVEWTLIVQVVTALLSLVGGAATVSVVTYLKNRFRLTGQSARFATAGVAVCVSVMALVVSGAIAPNTVTPENIVTIFILVMTTSQARYNKIRKEELLTGADIEPLLENK